MQLRTVKNNTLNDLVIAGLVIDLAMFSLFFLFLL
jgi:hypothetical protein